MITNNCIGNPCHNTLFFYCSLNRFEPRIRNYDVASLGVFQYLCVTKYATEPRIRHGKAIIQQEIARKTKKGQFEKCNKEKQSEIGNNEQ